MMCNQCDDLRRIHGNQKVWIVKQDGRSILQMLKPGDAHRAISILKMSNPDSVFEIIETNSAETRWG